MLKNFSSSAGELPSFALLDDALASTAVSRLYTGLQQVLQCKDVTQWTSFWQATQQALLQGQHAVALLSYETGAALQGITTPATSAGSTSSTRNATAIPSRIAIFNECRLLDAEQVGLWLQQQIDTTQTPYPSGIANLRASVDETRFKADIARIHHYIAAGDTYQVNYTFRLHFDVYGSPIALYQRLRVRQPVPYGALICLPDGEAVLSLSPELFVRHESGQLYAKPMKGTAAANGDTKQDAATAQTLAQDPKNRAENLMIVDLLRNDLGRIAQAGSVKVSRLFEVEKFSSVLQMTSSIEATLKPDANLADVLSALYPCGSITGAPKRRTMQIIREIEDEPRGLYTGAIGWFAPPATELSTSSSTTQALGDFCLSVPIRTLHLQAPDKMGLRKGSMGVGAGIVYDSVAVDEYAECQLKAKFLTRLPAEFSLFETIHASRNAGCRYLEKHLSRLQASAHFFGFKFDQHQITAALAEHQATLPPQGTFRLRLALSSDGEITLQSAPLMPLSTPVKVLIAAHRTRSDDLFLQHKTTWRSDYDLAWKAAEQQGAFDMLFFNQQGHLTEGGRSNVFVLIGGRWCTPQLSDGVLPGVMRDVTMAELAASERSITMNELRDAKKIIICNALRGAMEAELIQG